MMTRLLSITAIALLGLSLSPYPSHAFGISDLLGSDSAKDLAPATSATTIKNPLNQGIDALAGEGTSAIINGDVDPVVALAGKQLGIPTEYLPQIQKLYNTFGSTGKVTEANVTEQAGLSSWLGGSSMTTGGLASGLTSLFGTAQ